MSETVKLIVEIPKEIMEYVKNNDCLSVIYIDEVAKVIQTGIPLEEVKTKIDTDLSWEMFDEYGNETRLHKELIEILDNIGKGDKE